MGRWGAILRIERLLIDSFSFFPVLFIHLSGNILIRALKSPPIQVGPESLYRVMPSESSFINVVYIDVSFA